MPFEVSRSLEEVVVEVGLCSPTKTSPFLKLSEPIEELDVYRAMVESWFSYCNSMDPEGWSDWGKSNPNIPPLIFQVTTFL